MKPVRIGKRERAWRKRLAELGVEVGPVKRKAPPPPGSDSAKDEAALLEVDKSLPGAASHFLETQVACQGCGDPTRELYQQLNGVKVGPPRCRRCYREGLSPAGRARV